MGTLTVEIFGKRLRNPVMNASGTLGYGVEIDPLWRIETLGAYVTKGLSLAPHHGNPTPRVWEERTGMINSIGLQNIGVGRFFKQYFPVFKERQTPVIVNFFGFTEEEYVECARAIMPDDDIVALEMNLSCPNIKKGGISFGKEPGAVFDIVKKVKRVTPLPVVAKLTPEVGNIRDIAMAAYEGGADGLTLFNTMPAAAIDIREKSVPIRGGLSGAYLKPIALKAISEVSRMVPIPIIGVGGIMNREDAIAFLMAGSKAIQVGTATFVEPLAIPRIIKGIDDYLADNALSSVGDLYGSALA